MFAAAISLIGWLYLSFVWITSRVLSKDHAVFRTLYAGGRPFIYAFWHRLQFFLAYPHRGEKLAILVSSSTDGELIARTIRRFGLSAIRGSSSKGGLEALAEMLGHLKAGWRVAITPDGPKGPPRTVHHGVVILAQKTGLPVVPVAYAAKRTIVFKSWDRYVLPLPFNRIALVHGEPLTVGDGPLEEVQNRMRQALDAAAREAEALL